MADQVADVVEWAPDGPDPELERRLPVVEAAYGEVGPHAGHDAALLAVNRALVRAGMVALDTAELAADLDEIGRRRELELRARAGDTRAEPWELVEGPPVEPEPRDEAAERERIIATNVYRHADWWARIGRRYPLPNGATAPEIGQAERDRRQLLDDVNRELVAAGLEPIVTTALVDAMQRLHRAIDAPAPPPRTVAPVPASQPAAASPATRDSRGRFTRAGSRSVGGASIARTAREGR